MASLTQDMQSSPESRWKRVVRRLTPPRRIRFTAYGIWLVTLTLGVGFAGLNTGNNLLYFILGMMLTLIGMSGVMAELSISRLTTTRRPLSYYHAESPGQVVLHLENRKRWLPVMGVRVIERPGINGRTDGAFFVFVGPKQSQTMSVTYIFESRGLHSLPPLYVETTYPFGLFRRGYACGPPCDVLVYPRLTPVSEADRKVVSGGGELESHKKGQGDEFFGLRAYNEGDDIRSIHWKVSARRNRLVVRENAIQSRRHILIRFEPGKEPDEQAFESAISKVASFACDYLERDYQVAYQGPGENMSPASGLAHRQRILTALALLEIGQETGSHEANNDLGVLVVSISGGDVLTRLL